MYNRLHKNKEYRMFLLLPLTYIKEFFADQLGLYSYQNYIEVFVLSFLIYKGLRWLQQDHTKHLVLYVYGYSFIMFSSYVLSCTVLFWIMFATLPIFLITSIVIHQKQIQKNFMVASSKQITIHTMPSKNWFDVLVRSCLLASYHNKQIICIVERSQPLGSFLQTPYLLHIPIQHDIIELLFSSNALHTPCLLWINHSGSITSINSAWKETMQEQLFTTTAREQNIEAINLMSQRTDALIFSIDTSTHLGTLWYQSKTLHNISIDQLLTCGKQILQLSTMTQPFSSFEYINKQGLKYDHKNNADHSA